MDQHDDDEDDQRESTASQHLFSANNAAGLLTLIHLDGGGRRYLIKLIYSWWRQRLVGPIRTSSITFLQQQRDEYRVGRQRRAHTSLMSVWQMVGFFILAWSSSDAPSTRRRNKKRLLSAFKLDSSHSEPNPLQSLPHAWLQLSRVWIWNWPKAMDEGGLLMDINTSEALFNSLTKSTHCSFKLGTLYLRNYWHSHVRVLIDLYVYLHWNDLFESFVNKMLDFYLQINEN